MTLRTTIQPLITMGRKSRNRLFNLIDPPVVVLIYHRVTDLPSDPQQLAVAPENFRAQMRYLKDNLPILRFEEDWSDVRLPSVAVTFDDGYADNALEAMPILEEVGVPATFFVSTGNIGSCREFWWDDLERIILGERDFPISFTLEEGCSAGTWPTGDADGRRALYREMQTLMLRLDPRRRAELLGRIRLWAGVGEEGRERYRAMTVEELMRAAKSGWITVGAHTVTHTPLRALSAEEQREEMARSRKMLEDWLGRKISVFSYPFGNRGDYTRESVRLCREAGFSRVAANFPGQAHRWTDRFQIPRQLVRNWPVEVFAQRLKGFWLL